MSEKPILMCAEMVRATREGRKTQTRRIVKPQPSDEFSPSECQVYEPSTTDRDGEMVPGKPIFGCFDKYGEDEGYKCPHGQPGSRLWVKETFTTLDCHHGQVVFRADKPNVTDVRWRPSIFMPRWASRITLEIVSVKTERVHQITHRDVLAEGISEQQIDHWRKWLHKDDAPAHTFGVLWDSLNAKRDGGKYAWANNPWVWRIEFKVIRPGTHVTITRK